MSKILYVSRELTHMYFHLQYIKHLIENGHEVHIACEINKNTDDFKKCGIKLHNISFARKSISINHKIAYSQLKTLYNTENYDLIHFHTPIAGFIGRLAAKNTKAKIVYTAHGLHFFKGSPAINWILYYPLEKMAAKWTDVMILINKEDYNLVERKFSLRNNGQIYYINGVGVQLDLFEDKNYLLMKKYKKELNICKSDMVISCVGELNKNKNQIQLLQALNNSKNKENVSLLIVGEGNEKQNLKDYCDKNGLNKVQFLGYRRDVANLLAISDILVLVSHREGLPKSLMEGMASSLALLGTNTRGIRDIIKDGINGYIVEIGDYNTLSEKIDYLYEDRVKLSSMKKESHMLSNQYRIDFVIKQLDEIYNKIGV